MTRTAARKHARILDRRPRQSQADGSALASLFGRFAVELEGGFLLQEDPGMPCGPGRRCLHVFLLSSDRSGTIRRLVVDLVSRSIPYPVYTPSAVEAHER